MSLFNGEHMNELSYHTQIRPTNSRLTAMDLLQLESRNVYPSSDSSWSKKLLVVSKEHFELFPLAVALVKLIVAALT
jgi:hypothetical protein